MGYSLTTTTIVCVHVTMEQRVTRAEESEAGEKQSELIIMISIVLQVQRDNESGVYYLVGVNA